MDFSSVWEITAHTTVIDDDSPFRRQIPTGLSWGACRCGFRVEGPDRDPIPTADVVLKLSEHIRAAHPEWPEHLRP